MKVIGLIENLPNNEFKFIGYGEYFENDIELDDPEYGEFFDMGLKAPMVKFSDGSIESILKYQWGDVESINDTLKNYISKNYKIYYPSNNRMIIPSV